MQVGHHSDFDMITWPCFSDKAYISSWWPWHVSATPKFQAVFTRWFSSKAIFSSSWSRVKRQQLAQQRNTKPASFFTCKLWKSPDPCQISWLKDAISSSQNYHFSNIHTMVSTRTDINEYIYKYMSASYENIFQFFQPLPHFFLQRQ